MPQNATQVVAGRDILVYTEPYLPGNTFVANATVWGTTWGGTWVEAGYTRDGLRFRMSVQRQVVLVDQVVDPILRIAQSRDINMATRLAQINALNLSNATGQGTIVSNASQDDYVIGGVITDQYITTGFDIRNPGDLLPIRIIGWKGLVQADVEMSFNTQEAATINFDVGILPDTGTVATPVVPTRVATFRDVLT